MLRIDYRESDWRAVLRWGEDEEVAPWLAIVRRLAMDASEDAQQEGAWQISLPWWGFASRERQISRDIQGIRARAGSRT